MPTRPPAFLAKVEISGKFQGTGILVRPDLVLTCHHVLEQAGPNQTITVEIAGHTLALTCPASQRDKTADLALLRLPNELGNVEIPEWSERVTVGCDCEYFAWPDKWGRAIVRAEHSDHLEIEILVKPGASGGALMRSRQGRFFYVGIVSDGNATPAIAQDKSAVDAFLQAQDASRYLDILRGETRWIELRDIGADPSDHDAEPAIDALYHPLMTLSAATREKPDSQGASDARKPLPLEDALKDKRLLIEGGPGSGKTTFLRRIAWALCRNDSKNETLHLPFTGFPLWIRIRDLDEHMTAVRTGTSPAPTTSADPDWLVDFLVSGRAKLSRTFVESKLAEPNNILLIDGLDEAGNTDRRRHILDMIAAAAAAARCRFVVTTRPGGASGKSGAAGKAISGKSTLTGFKTVAVAEWERPETEAFCLRWSRWLKGNSNAAAEHAKGLAEAVAATPRQLRSNPLMLTALAVIYRPDTRLPDERALLYEAIMDWLSKKAEEHARDRSTPAAGYTKDQCLTRLGRLALEMQEWRKGQKWRNESGTADRQTLRAGIEDAARRIEDEFRTVSDHARFEAAKAFLEEAQVQSGIVTLRGGEIEFWHRSFQEYLAARRLKGFPDKELLALATRFLISPEGREVLPLFAGSMSPQSDARLDEIFPKLMRSVMKKPLARRAHAVGVLGAMLADIRKTYRLSETVLPLWTQLLAGVMEIFDREKGAALSLESRVAAADALGSTRDPRLFMPWEDKYWVQVPAGSFTMSAQKTNPTDKATYDEAAVDDETPRRVTFPKPFEIGRFPVTVWEYERYLADQTGVREPDEWEEQRKSRNSPIVAVSWNEAAAYCQWAGRGRAVMLPTEEQWEFAARGPGGRRYPWGNDVPTPIHANCSATEQNRVVPVGLFPAGNTPGETPICDLAGNVYEWTRSVYNEKRYGDEAQCVRGGSFDLSARALRAAYRVSYEARNRFYYIGFRCIRE
jgi:formylglycine-generating enzyme required for sulfatase activity